MTNLTTRMCAKRQADDSSLPCARNTNAKRFASEAPLNFIFIIIALLSMKTRKQMRVLLFRAQVKRHVSQMKNGAVRKSQTLPSLGAEHREG